MPRNKRSSNARASMPKSQQNIYNIYFLSFSSQRRTGHKGRQSLLYQWSKMPELTATCHRSGLTEPTSPKWLYRVHATAGLTATCHRSGPTELTPPKWFNRVHATRVLQQHATEVVQQHTRHRSGLTKVHATEWSYSNLPPRWSYGKHTTEVVLQSQKGPGQKYQSFAPANRLTGESFASENGLTAESLALQNNVIVSVLPLTPVR